MCTTTSQPKTLFLSLKKNVNQHVGSIIKKKKKSLTWRNEAPATLLRIEKQNDVTDKLALR